jgi:hypothetical protein
MWFVWIEFRGYVHFERAKHVLVATNLFAVQPNCGKRVKTLKHKPKSFISFNWPLDWVEDDPIPPLPLLYPSTGSLVLIVERIGYLSGRDERAMHASWNLRFQPVGIGEVNLMGSSFDSLAGHEMPKLATIDHFFSL